MLGIAEVPGVRKFLENPAYTDFWSQQAVDKWLAERPLTVPTRIVVGDGDPVASPALLEGAPADVAVEVLPGVGHFVPEEAPEVVAERVRALFG